MVSARENFRGAEDWLVSESGPPATGDWREWHYEWGRVGLAYEPRDGAAEAYVEWEPLHSQLIAEMQRRLRS